MKSEEILRLLTNRPQSVDDELLQMVAKQEVADYAPQACEILSKALSVFSRTQTFKDNIIHCLIVCGGITEEERARYEVLARNLKEGCDVGHFTICIAVLLKERRKQDVTA